jgi:hypothetical protein
MQSPLSRLRTHYDNLKVSRDAPDFVIRAAYKTLTQKYHPDKNHSPDAARIMQLINRSYGVLSDPELRAEHDAWILEQEAKKGSRPDPADTRGTQEHSSVPPRQPQAAPKRPLVFPKGGSASADSLPAHVLRIVADRSRGRSGDQAHLALGPTVAGSVGRATIAATWLLVVYMLSLDGRWAFDMRFGLGGISALAGIYFGAQLYKLYLLRFSPFRPSLNVTPLYVVETTWDRVSYWPVSLVRGIQGIDHHRNGGYTHTSFDLELVNDKRSYVTDWKYAYDSIVNCLNEARTRYRAAEQSGKQSIIDSVDELKGTQLQEGSGNLRKGYGFLFGWLGGCLVFLLAFFMLALINQEQPPVRTGSTYASTPRSAPEYQSQPPAAEGEYRPESPATTKPERPATDYIAERIGADRIPSGAAYIRGEPRNRTGGLSTVTVDNARTSDDVLVKLVAVSGERAWPVRTFFIPAGKQFTVEDIRQGAYEIRYMDRHSGNVSKSEMFTLEETETDDGTEYTNMTLTLYKVAGGNMHVQRIDPSEF